MAFNCRLNRNITLASLNNVDNDPCGMGSTVMSAAGIRDGIYVFNIEDVKNLVFAEDARPDDNLIINNIVTSEPYYQIGATSLSYTEEYDNGKWTHTLTGTLGNILTEFEDILSDAVNGKYLVCFKPNGEENYRVFGWRYGASVSYSTSISTDNTTYSITFKNTSEYPLFGCYKDNFNVETKVYSPVWKGLASSEYCEVLNGKKTGYLTLGYVVKVNSAGEALDKNNMLCQYSKLKQDAYKLLNNPDGDYNIVGTYAMGDTVNGIVVRQKNTNLCPLNNTGSITLSTNSINLNSTTALSAELTLTSNGPWVLETTPRYCTVNMSSGSGGTSKLIFTYGNGGFERLTFKNIATGEEKQVEVHNNIIKVQAKETFPHGTTSVTIPTEVSGDGSGFTISSSAGSGVVNSDGTFTISGIPTSNQTQTINVEVRHGHDSNEKKQIKITIIGNDMSQAKWSIISQFCEE